MIPEDLPPFSVLMSVYVKEKRQNLKESIASLLNQTLLPNEIVIVKDGALGESLDSVLEDYSNDYPGLFKILALKENQGLGSALNFGLRHASHEYIARMDSDDICAPQRFEKQMTFLAAHPEIDIIGSLLSEFEFSIDTEKGRIRNVPESNDEVRQFIKYRCPVNHQTVIFKRSKVLLAGGYNTDKINYEDFPLWYRMISRGVTFYNVQEPLVYARTGNDLIGRRHGRRYLAAEIKLFTEMYNDRFITFLEYLGSIVPRIGLRLLPKPLLQRVYRTLFRSK